ncbi:MAG TPA: hypothetical protein VNV61_08400 [Steroidobacteraceae bacterium]|jgi:hypothetical protein|nr:hypothetical protein [Steroidobacteraceae bacterium]
MNRNMRCHLPGKFTAQDLGGGAWRLARRNPMPAEVLLRGADPRAAEVLSSHDLGDIDIEWQTATVELWATSSGRRTAIASHSAIVHEPMAQLYEGLPLARIDGKSRRFWRRVFWLVRIPGGRLLLAAVARRTRARQ